MGHDFADVYIEGENQPVNPHIVNLISTLVICCLEKNGLIYYMPNLNILADPEVIKLLPCSTQLSTKFILLINVKIPTTA